MRIVQFAAISILSVLYGCGGGSGSSGGGGSQNQSSAPTLVTAGDKQHAFSGGNLLYPIVVQAQDANANPIPGLLVTFTAPSGVTVFPPQVTTGKNGEARALVNLPDTPFSQFVISATTNKGGSATFTEYTGPRLLGEFGDASASQGAVLANGTIIAQADGGVVFAPDGMSRRYLGSLLKTISVPDPDPGNPGFPNSDFGAAVSPDQKVYLFSYKRNAMFVLDATGNLLRFLDFEAINGTTPVYNARDFAVAPNGTIFGSGLTVSVYDPNGVLQAEVDTGITTLGTRIVASNDNNFVELYATGPSLNYAVSEYDLKGNIVRSAAIPGLGRGIARDSVGNYAVLECCNPSVVQFFDQNFKLLQTATLPVSGNYGGEGFYIDDAWNIYVNLGGPIDKFDSAGNWVWQGVGASPPAFVNKVGTGGMAVDSVSNNLYVSGGAGPGGIGGISIFANGQYTGSFGPGGQQQLAIDSSRRLYAIGQSTMEVFDTVGNVLQTLTYPQIQNPTSLAITSDDNKFVFDSALGVVHHIDSSNTYISSFPVNLPSGATLARGEVAPDYDGNLIVGIGVFNPTGSTNNDTYIKKVTRSGVEIWSVGSTEKNAPLQNVATDTSGRIYLLRTLRLEVLDQNGSLTGQVDLETGGALQPEQAGMTSAGDRIYFLSGDRIYATSFQ